jgi:hypothetical protein
MTPESSRRWTAALLALLVLTCVPAPADAQSPASRLEGMWSDPPTDESGKAVPWVVEFAGRLNLSEFGWTADSVKPGERVTVTGNPTDTGSQRMFFRKLVRADGTELLPGTAQSLNVIDEQRRRCALERDQQK